MTGSISAIISASASRLASRTQRLTMVIRSVNAELGRGAEVSTMLSDTSGLLLLLLDSRCRVTGQREEHVVERRAVHIEFGDEGAAWVNLVEQVPDVDSRAVGRHADGEQVFVDRHGPVAH